MGNGVQAVRAPESALGGAGSGVLAVGFGTAVAMWGVGYVGRLPTVLLSAPALLFLLLVCLLAGGVLAGRYVTTGWRAGALAGTLTGLLNLLVLGSLLTGDRPNEIVPSALVWVPGSVALSALVAALGAAGGARWRSEARPRVAWPAVFVRVAIAATLLLLAVGGLVTSKEVGLAVVDWPNSYGYNMFLYPLSRMTGGIYYEHAHRLFGALVGLTTLVMAVFLQRVESRGWVRGLAWLAFVMVVVQGFLGGLRVTGRLTLAVDDLTPSLTLAVVHGVVAQLFFSVLVALGAFTSAGWRSAREATARAGARADTVLGWLLVGGLIAQLVLGAIQRHTGTALLAHVGMAALIAPLAMHYGARAWGTNPEQPLLRRLGLTLAVMTAVQVVLGIGAFVLVTGVWNEPGTSGVAVTVTTLHQWCGALLLGSAVLVACWNHRLLAPVPQS